MRRVDGAVALSVERGGEKVRAKGRGGGGGGRVRDVSRACRVVGAERATSEKSEAASESSVPTTATGPERSPGKPARKRAVVSGELGRARRDRGPATPGAGRPRGEVPVSCRKTGTGPAPALPPVPPYVPRGSHPSL
ncbi:hypothetical protein E2562_015205 [Oryza meyeriana var. granulata]|uniref:Uncharacterized protein n=1 Tax=Oryza meyeriana var. granulata TaxID=110450 RepID=A0A6G1EWV7_9ORYZ|nr:hypothetical protein E2562_015205 [Oryza meyeriana var. granulata]